MLTLVSGVRVDLRTLPDGRDHDRNRRRVSGTSRLWTANPREIGTLPARRGVRASGPTDLLRRAVSRMLGVRAGRASGSALGCTRYPANRKGTLAAQPWAGLSSGRAVSRAPGFCRSRRLCCLGQAARTFDRAVGAGLNGSAASRRGRRETGWISDGTRVCQRVMGSRHRRGVALHHPEEAHTSSH